MEKSLNFVPHETYLMEEDLDHHLPNCFFNPGSRIRVPSLQNPTPQHDRTPHDQTVEEQEQEQEEQEQEQEENGDSIDRLSALPDILCQQIVSLMPATDARGTMFLSKRWRFVWYACPSFVFDEREFYKRLPPPAAQRHRNRQNFVRFVNEALESRIRLFDDLTIEKFKVSMRFVEELTPYLDNWIDFALKRKVKELSIVAEMKDLIAIAEFFHPFRTPYTLSPSVFTTRTIQSLELVFCDLSSVSSTSIDLPLLKNLDMINVHLNDSILQSILSGSPSLEKLNLSLTFGLEKIQVSGDKLKMLVVFKCFPLDEVVVKAPNLESFLFRGKRQHHDRVDISSCRKLKFLWLQRASNLTDDALEKATRQNPDLEIMILIHCSSLKNAVIQSPKLWMFVLFKCKRLSVARIEAPTLHAFEYSGHMIAFPTLVSSSQLDAIIHMDGPEISSRWYAKLKQMCTRFDHCRTLYIRCEHDTDLIVPPEIRKRLLPQLHGLSELKIHVRNGGNMNLSKLEDGIRWIFPELKNLYVESKGSMHHFQYAEEVGGDVGTAWTNWRDFIKTEII